MAQFLISTTGTLSPVSFPDIGSRDFVHPTVDLDMIATEGFTLEELLGSVDLAAALDAGHITVKDAQGNVITSSTDLDKIGVTHAIGAHSDIDFSTAPVSGDQLTYDSFGKWKGTKIKKDEFVPGFAGQVTYILSTAPTDPTTVRVKVNGVEADDGIDFVVSGTTLTWLNAQFTLDSTDKVQVDYR